MPNMTPRIHGEDIWCLRTLLANNIDRLPMPTCLTAEWTTATTFSLIVESHVEVEQWAEAMRVDATITPSYDGDLVAADGWMECSNHGRGGPAHNVKVAVTNRLGAFTAPDVPERFPLRDRPWRDATPAEIAARHATDGAA